MSSEIVKSRDDTPNENERFDELFYDLARWLESPVLQERQKTWQRIEGILWDRPLQEVTERLADTTQLEPFALLGWMEYCITEKKPIRIKVLEDAFSYNFKVYLERKDIISSSSPDRWESIRDDLEWLATRIQSFVDNISTTENPRVLYYAYLFRAKVLLYIEENPEKAITFIKTDEEMLGHSYEAILILAEAYERQGDYQEAYDVYQELQVNEASHIYLEKQLFLLFTLGRDDEAKQLHAFWSGITDFRKNTLRPLCYYRWTIESDEDISTLYLALLPFFGGEDINEKSKALMLNAQNYIEKEFQKVQAQIQEAIERWEDIFAEEFCFLWIRGLFLLEISTCVLLSSWKIGDSRLNIPAQFIDMLMLLFRKYLENPKSSILEKYFQKHDDNWINVIRKIQCEEVEDKDAESLEDEATVRDVRSQILKEDEADIDISKRVVDILDFLSIRIENETNEFRQLQDIMIDFHNEISRRFPDIDFFDEEGATYAWNFLSNRLSLLDENERQIYNQTSQYISEKYGSSIRQLVIFLSLNTENFTELRLGILRKEPKILLFALATTLLWDELPYRPRVKDLLEEAILEWLSREETLFLVRLLFREGYYDEICSFLWDTAHLLSYPEFVEFFIVSVSLLDELQGQMHLDDLESEILPDRFGYDGIAEYLENMKDSYSEEAHPDEVILSRLDHTSMWYEYITEEDHSIECDLTPIKIDAELSSLEATYCFSIFRMLPPATNRNGPERLTYIMSLFPFLDLEKREAIQVIFALALNEGRRDILERYIAIATDEELYIGHWKYAPLFLGDSDSQMEAISLLANDINIASIPEPIMYQIYKTFETYIHKADRDASISYTTQFQISFLLAHSGQNVKEVLEQIHQHFLQLQIIIKSILEDWYITEEKASEISKLFGSIWYEPQNIINHSIIESNVYWNELLVYLVRHIRGLKKYLSEELKSGFDAFNSEIISKAEVIEFWESSIEIVSQIFAFYPPNSLIWLSAEGFIESLRKEAKNLFGEDSDVSDKPKAKWLPEIIVFDSNFSF
jgi:hypothetical protein